MRLVAALLAGLVSTATMFPFMGDDLDDPSRLSIFGWGVPFGPGAGQWFALAVGIIFGILAWYVGARVNQRRW